jgi:hypothetical protein
MFLPQRFAKTPRITGSARRFLYPGRERGQRPAQKLPQGLKALGLLDEHVWRVQDNKLSALMANLLKWT